MRFSETAITILMLLALVALSASAQDAESVRDAARSFLGDRAEVSPLDMTINDALRAEVRKRCGSAPGPRTRIWSVAKGEERQGYAVSDDVKGKSRPITFLAVYATDGTLRGIEILKYRESHGYQVKSSVFRDQFKGKTADDPIVVGKDIRNVSGATISSRSVTDGVRALTVMIGLLRERKELP